MAGEILVVTGPQGGAAGRALYGDNAATPGRSRMQERLVALAVLALVASIFAPVPVVVVGVAAVTLAIALAGGLVLGVAGQRLGGAASTSPVGLRQRAATFGRHTCWRARCTRAGA